MQLFAKLALAAFAVSLSLAQAQAADAPGKKGQRPGGGDFKAKLLEKFDTNKDGQLSDAEKQAARAEFEKRKGETGKGGPGKGGPGRGFGKGGPGGFDREALMKKLDKNGDGKLDDAEKQAAREAFGKKRAEK